MNEDDYRRELARKDSVISDLASQLAQTNQQLAELMQRDAAKGSETPTSATPAAEQTPAQATEAKNRALLRAIGMPSEEHSEEPLPLGAMAFIRASAIAEKR